MNIYKYKQKLCNFVLLFINSNNYITLIIMAILNFHIWTYYQYIILFYIYFNFCRIYNMISIIMHLVIYTTFIFKIYPKFIHFNSFNVFQCLNEPKVIYPVTYWHACVSVFASPDYLLYIIYTLFFFHYNLLKILLMLSPFPSDFICTTKAM